MAKERKPLIIIVSAPSGSGKTTIVSGLVEGLPDIKRSVSYTTRAPRQDEKDGIDYIFISQEEFKKKIENGEFLEWEENFDYCYGTSKEQVEEAVKGGEDVVLSIDVKGAKRVKRIFPQSISIFIMPPSMEELSSRLKNRKTDREEQVSMRLEESKTEIASSDEYEYLIVNDDLQKAIEELKEIVENARKRSK
ncbi:MAG: guanylate kinase [Candidatus Omnitrophota bacterium]